MQSTCSNCTYWVPRRNFANGELLHGAELRRWCTARPPVVTADNETMFPITPAWLTCACWENRDLS